MQKIWRLQQLYDLKLELRKEVIESIRDIIITMDKEYGKNRDVNTSLGGYVLLLETKDDVINVKENILKNITTEYIDDIESEGGKQYCLSLFLLS